MREPSKPSRGARDTRRSSEPSVKPPSNREDVVDYSYLDKYKPPPQYMTNRERELLRSKEEKERNNNNLKYESSKPRYPYQSENKPSDVPANSKQSSYRQSLES